MTERHRTVLPQRDLISWKSKASVFLLGNKSTCSQRLNPIPLLRPKEEGGDVIPTDLGTAFRIILLWLSLSTQDPGMHLLREREVLKGMGAREGIGAWSPWSSLRPWL